MAAAMGAPVSDEAATEPASFSGRGHAVSKRCAAGVVALSPEEARVRAVAEVVSALVRGVQEGQDVDLNELKTKARAR